MLNVGTTAGAVEAIIDYVFTNKLLCAEAVQMASPQTAIVHGNCFRGLENNKRLAILGDAVLSKALCAIWFRARDNGGYAHSPAQWTTMRNDQISNDALAQRGQELGIDDCVYVNDGTHDISPKMVATTLAAVIGAVFEDGGDDAALHVIENLGFFDHAFLTVTSRSIHCGSQDVVRCPPQGAYMR